MPKKRKGLITKYVLITPKKAQAWLDTQAPNRIINADSLRNMIRDIINETWDELLGETIKISSDGRLLDGQV